MAPTRERRCTHDPGVVLRDLAVAIADGGDHVSRPRRAARPACPVRSSGLRDDSPPGGEVDRRRGAGSDPRRPRRGAGQCLGAGARPEELILDIDASLLTAHSEKEGAAGTYKGGFGFHPLLCYLAETGEPLAAILRPGNAAAHTAADHFEVLALALEQLPEADLDREILARTDIGGRTHAFTSDCRDAGIRFSVGYEVDQRVRDAITGLTEAAWRSAIDGDGAEREGAQVAELTDRVELSSWPEATRLLVRRERPHPGAQLSVFDCEAGYRHTAFITDQEDADIAALELRHRRRARVEDAIRTGKETGMRKLPFSAFAHNRAWLEVSLAAQALLRWTALLCLPGELALAEPKRVRQRLLHVAGRLVRSGRRVALRLPCSWPWAEALVAAFTRLRALPVASSP